MTRIWLVADDYGISPAVNAAIRDLLARKRLSATSVMVVAPAFTLEEAEAVGTIDGAAIGLHVTLTAPFKPLSRNFAPLTDGAFPKLGSLAAWALLKRIDPLTVAQEVRTQIAAFMSAFGRPPDFIDGHQHVHLLPGVSEGFLSAVQATAPGAWVRQCGRAKGARTPDTKARLLDLFSARFRRRAATLGVRTNPVFAGAYAFRPQARFADLFPTFLTGMSDGGVIMCHPGVVDAGLAALDPLTTLREREYEYFKGEAFPALLRGRGVTLLP
jgi:predicted glycoside hydrolase/deacetylase ChbG (UPF0249 family)